MKAYEKTMDCTKEHYDLQILAKILSELTANVRLLAEAQKDLANMVHAQSNYLERNPSKSNTDLNLTLNKIHDRLSKLEEHRLITTAANKARVNLVEKVARYTPLILAILLAFISVEVVLTIKELPIK